MMWTIVENGGGALGCTLASPAEEVDAAISAWTAKGRSRVSGQELREAREKLREGLASDANGREISPSGAQGI